MIRLSNLRKMCLVFGILHYPFCVNHSLELTVADNLGIRKFRLYSGDTGSTIELQKGQSWLSCKFDVHFIPKFLPAFKIEGKDEYDYQAGLGRRAP
ncbi:hypothetical protein PanWU01x14_206460 [Parasponia andersonii]|uniref:Uncharacterized protein n=1 Tax=Parasponia andersonii TaxID=3476 RepID=A0A2P5BVJ0_PARAD|nr:hypothetical protein PanWU01x14_206460 [Parasponia andersonii]